MYIEFRKIRICIALKQSCHNLEFLYKWVAVVGGSGPSLVIGRFHDLAQLPIQATLVILFT